MNNKIKGKKIAELVEVFNNLRVPLSGKEREKIDKIYPYYGAQSIVDYVDNFIFDGEYLLVAEDGENLRSNNQNICNLVNGKFWVNNHAHILTANKENNTKYLYYNFNRINFEPYVTGSAQPKLNKENLLNIVTHVHDLEDQQKIVSVLYSLDSKIELNNRINAELEAMAKTLYDYWFVQFDFPNAKGKPYKTSGGKMIWNEELKREIPEGWEVKSLLELSIIASRGISPKYIESDGICVLNQKCIRDNKIIYSFSRRHDNESKDSSSRRIKAYDVLVNSTGVGTLGRVAMVKRMPEEFITVDSHITIVRPNARLIDELYFGHSIIQKQAEIEGFSLGSTGQVELSRYQLESIKVVLPAQEIQKQFRTIYSPALEKMANNEIENEWLTELRDWLLPMLMNGQVKVA